MGARNGRSARIGTTVADSDVNSNFNTDIDTEFNPDAARTGRSSGLERLLGRWWARWNPNGSWTVGWEKHFDDHACPQRRHFQSNE
jgi:hypothetical protein